MLNTLARARRWTTHAAANLANAEAASDEKARHAHLAITKHFLLLAEEEIRQAKRHC
jgi:hypothetical protein